MIGGAAPIMRTCLRARSTHARPLATIHESGVADPRLILAVRPVALPRWRRAISFSTRFNEVS